MIIEGKQRIFFHHNGYFLQHDAESSIFKVRQGCQT